MERETEAPAEAVRQELTEAEARELLTNRIPEAIREEYGGFLRAFLVKMADGKSVCLIVLERGYFVQFNQDPEKARERGIAASLALYASPETAFALATLYALFGDTLRDERLFWDKIDPAQGAALLETLEGVKGVLEEEGGAHARAGELREGKLDAVGNCVECKLSMDLHSGDGSCPSEERQRIYREPDKRREEEADAEEAAGMEGS